MLSSMLRITIFLLLQKEYFDHNKDLLFYERQKEIIQALENLDFED